MADPIAQLAAARGIVPEFRDVTGTLRVTRTDTQLALLAALGEPVTSAADAAERLAMDVAQAGGLPRWCVVRSGERPDLGLSPVTDWQILCSGGLWHEGRGPRLPQLPVGRHILHVADARCTLLVAPVRLPLPPRLWGLIVPLAGLRPPAQGGVGDYGDLARMTAGAAAHGADFLGLNPVHAGFATDPGGFSPYTPSHRRRLSSLHIAVPETTQGGGPLIDYATEIPARLAALKAAFAQFAAGGDDPAFDAYIAQGGTSLRSFAAHQALSERHGPYWNHWPLPLQNPQSAAVEAEMQALAPQLRFHMWLQWQAETQLGAAATRARNDGMRLGLYLDLAVGTHPHGAETWEDRKSFAFGASLGAPPDAFARDGQNWQLAPFNPNALIDDGFGALAQTLRRQLRFAGALRIDHILGFDRAYWVPDGAPGAYVQMPLEAMLAVVRIEAACASAVIVGEDLGNIPAGLQTALADSGILGCRLTMFEQDWADPPRFHRPDSYPQASIASFSTHDLPTWRGWRAGHEIGLRESLGSVTADVAAEAQIQRKAEVAALDTALSPSEDAGSVDTMHYFLGATASRLVAVQVENVLDILEQPNLPGTVSEYPNWRQRLPMGPRKIGADPRLARVAATMKRHGR
ncbi:4-alpha-glucanotransferase [Puniceibacterium sp. IMCC21224]|uniref:4-alpha-glucanotransferase n=1 Tax=Puniceibacterium sp. IMCC21224 TaxID=1618204 RepID=UPI00064DD3BA|nr:4-alpha-glucanotransferase [Puniceibacterium sp. IMCC21224]KMK67438.1 4-alpha-glucanotransferase [Puniceibacterium sp. IMCC21224]